MMKQGVQRNSSVANNIWSLLTNSLKTGMIMLIVVMALLVTALAHVEIIVTLKKLLQRISKMETAYYPIK